MYFEKFDGQEYFSTQSFHNDRSAANHLEEAGHKDRLHYCADLINSLVSARPELSVVDYGAGSGGLISLINTENKIGYDFTPANVEFAKKKGRNVEYRDFVNNPLEEPGDVVVITECLEHLDDPIGFLESVQKKSQFLVMSMPVGETNQAHYEFHTHGADEEGVRYYMLEATEWWPVLHKNINGTQIWLAASAG